MLSSERWTILIAWAYLRSSLKNSSLLDRRPSPAAKARSMWGSREVASPRKRLWAFISRARTSIPAVSCASKRPLRIASSIARGCGWWMLKRISWKAEDRPVGYDGPGGHKLAFELRQFHLEQRRELFALLCVGLLRLEPEENQSDHERGEHRKHRRHKGVEPVEQLVGGGQRDGYGVHDQRHAEHRGEPAYIAPRHRVTILLHPARLPGSLRIPSGYSLTPARRPPPE